MAKEISIPFRTGLGQNSASTEECNIGIISIPFRTGLGQNKLTYVNRAYHWYLNPF